MYYIRWATDKDMKRIADLDDTAFGVEAYNKKELSSIRKSTKTKFLVCDDNYEDLYGYCIYTIGKEKLYIIRLVVDPEYMTIGIGTTFMNKLKEKWSVHFDKNTIPVIEMELEDDNLVGHLFMKSHGFKVFKVLWGGTGENDLYRFRYTGADVPSKLP